MSLLGSVVVHSSQKLLPVVVRRLWNQNRAKAVTEREKHGMHVLKFSLACHMGLMNRFAKFCLLNWSHMRYHISANFIRVIKQLYDKATNAVLFNSSIGDWFRTTAGVNPPPPFSNIFLKMFMTDAVEDHKDTAGIVHRAVTSLRLLMTSMA